MVKLEAGCYRVTVVVIAFGAISMLLLLSRCEAWAVDDTNPGDRHRTCLQSLLTRVDDR